MESEPANRRLAFNDQLSFANAALSDLIEELPYIAHLKDIQTGKYIRSNYHWIETLGLESADEIYGLTVEDLTSTEGVYAKWNFSHAFTRWKNDLPKEIHRLESQVKNTKQPANIRRAYFTAEGSIRVSNLIKQPVLNYNKELIAVLTLSQDLTPKQDLSKLLRLYLEYYPERQAIQQLSMYLNIDGYFTALPTLEEMQALLVMSQHADFAEWTDDPHIRSLQNKVDAANWYELLTRLSALPMHTDEYDA